MSDKTITIRIDEETHKKIKIRIANEGITLKDYILKLVNEDLKKSDRG